MKQESGIGKNKRLVPVILMVLSFFLSMTNATAKSETGKTAANKQTTARDAGEKKAIGKISIIGNSEMPEANFNIPWKSPTISKEINDPPPTSLKGMLVPMEPAQHKNRLYFQDNLKLDVQELKSR